MNNPEKPSTPSGSSAHSTTKATDHELPKYDIFTRYGQLKLRKLAVRLHAQAERCVRDLEARPESDVETLMQALQVRKLARLEAIGRRGRGGIRTGPAITGAWTHARDEAIRTALSEMRADAPSRSPSVAPLPQTQNRPRDSFGMVLPRSLCTPPGVRLRVEPDPPAITAQRP